MHQKSASGSTSPFATTAPASSILIRFLVGLAVFVPEGIQKLIFPDILGTGRFATIGIPYPEVMGPFVGIVEIVCGALIIAGFLTRLAAIPLIIIMIVALVSTKEPILLGQDFWIFHLPKASRYGFWSMMHEARTDICMLLASLYLLIAGAGAWSADALISRKIDLP
jgi:putative oxidoreductase